MTERMCKSCGKWHDLDRPWPKRCARGTKNNAPYVISDTMIPTKHMATGRVIDSKAKFRAETRASGCIEIGNEAVKARKSIPLDRGKRRDDIKKAIYDLRNQR